MAEMSLQTFLQLCCDDTHVRKSMEEVEGVVGKDPLKRSYYWCSGTNWLGDNVQLGKVADICYASFPLVDEVIEAYVWLPTLPQARSYVSAVMNSNIWGDAFITKDKCEGAIELNVDCYTMLVKSAIISLRTPYEHRDALEMFNRLKNMGASDMEAIYLSNAFTISEERIVSRVASHGIEVNKIDFHKLMRYGVNTHEVDVPLSNYVEDKYMLGGTSELFPKQKNKHYKSDLLKTVSSESKADIFGNTSLMAKNDDETLLSILKELRKES